MYLTRHGSWCKLTIWRWLILEIGSYHNSMIFWWAGLRDRCSCSINKSARTCTHVPSHLRATTGCILCVLLCATTKRTKARIFCSTVIVLVDGISFSPDMPTSNPSALEGVLCYPRLQDLTRWSLFSWIRSTTLEPSLCQKWSDNLLWKPEAIHKKYAFRHGVLSVIPAVHRVCHVFLAHWNGAASAHLSILVGLAKHEFSGQPPVLA